MGNQPQNIGREQAQFLNVIDRDEAERRFHEVLDLSPLGTETVPLRQARGRSLATDVLAPVDVPCFDRSNVDGYAVQAADTFGASEERPRRLSINAEVLATGVASRHEVRPGTASVIATGGMVPRGADAVVMVEHTGVQGDQLEVYRPLAPGDAISFAGSDIGRGEMVLRKGESLSSRETGVLAALGIAQVTVHRRPKVAVISTGDEIIAPGQQLRPGLVFDSNATILCDAVAELGGIPVALGIVADDIERLRDRLLQALDNDVVILSGGTSKGAGDLSYRVVDELAGPGIVAHGVALKPGKPICLAAAVPGPGRRPVPVVILPGFPTSAIFTFHEFVAPVIRQLAGMPHEPVAQVSARLPVRVVSDRGRTEYLLVGLVDGGAGLAAYPMGRGSGSVTAFSRADGFVTIPRLQEQLDENAMVQVRLLGQSVQPADLVAIGSHCTGLDYLLSRVQEAGFRVKAMSVGSTAGLMAAARGECDIAGVHLLDPATGRYNESYVAQGLHLAKGYRRMQGLVFRREDKRFLGRDALEVLGAVLRDRSCRMVNRNRGSGTRVLFDSLREQILAGQRLDPPAGYSVEVRSHNAVAAAVAQGRADWGIAIASVVQPLELGFLPIREEEFDFVIPQSRMHRPAVHAFLATLQDANCRRKLHELGFELDG